MPICKNVKSKFSVHTLDKVQQEILQHEGLSHDQMCLLDNMPSHLEDIL